MQRAGSVERIAQGLLVLRSAGEDVPSIGTPVVDENLDSIGRIVDVFGPVDRPFLSVSPDDGVHPPQLLNQPLYIR